MRKFKDGKLVVSIDPGYDGTKVTVNGARFSIPKKTIRKQGNEYESTGSLDGIYEVTTKDGSFLCGPNIQVLVDDNNELHQRFDKSAEQAANYSYFNTREFAANTLAALELALIKASKSGVIDPAKISKENLYVVVELPHDSLKDMSRAVADALLGEHEYTFKGTVDGEDIDTKVNIEIGNEEHFFTISQVIACLSGYMSDDEGYPIDSLKDKFPVLVIDGGYYTMGDCAMSKTQAISGADSNTEFGMMTIHERTAKAINSKCHTNYKAYDMDNLFSEEKGIVVIPKNLSKSGKNESFDCNKILEEQTREVFNEYLAYLEEKYDCFKKIKMILFGGGTGKIYYDLFQEVAADYPNLVAKLVTYKMDGEEVTPREAISAGGYKMALNRLPD